MLSMNGNLVQVLIVVGLYLYLMYDAVIWDTWQHWDKRLAAACRQKNKCQPNFRRNVLPDPHKSCGPYRMPSKQQDASPQQRITAWPSHVNHDTIAMVAMDAQGNIAAGASSNGAAHKVQNRCDSCSLN